MIFGGLICKALLPLHLALMATIYVALSCPGQAQFVLDKHTDLIYGFAAQYKYIRRISLLCCHEIDSRLDQNQTILSSARTSIDTSTMTESLLNAGGILIKVFRIGTVTRTAEDTRLQQILKSEVHRQLIVLDLSCGNNSLKILELASDRGLFNSSYHWLLIKEDYSVNRPNVDKDKDNRSSSDGGGMKDVSLLIEFLAKLNINMNTELMLARKIDQDQKDYFLYDVWNPGRQYGGKLNVTEVGRFSQRNGLQMYDWFGRTNAIVRRMDMKNAPIRCMIVITNRMSENFVHYLNHKYKPHVDSMHRFNFALLSHVRDMFNFSFILYRTNSWGYLKNGIYDGMIGALVRGEVDIGGSPIFFRTERAHVIDYTAKTWIARPCFIFRHPTTLTRNVFLQPFSNGVWLCIAVSGLTAIALLWRLRRTEENLLNETSRHETLSFYPTVHFLGISFPADILTVAYGAAAVRYARSAFHRVSLVSTGEMMSIVFQCVEEEKTQKNNRHIGLRNYKTTTMKWQRAGVHFFGRIGGSREGISRDHKSKLSIQLGVHSRNFPCRHTTTTARINVRKTTGRGLWNNKKIQKAPQLSRRFHFESMACQANDSLNDAHSRNDARRRVSIERRSTISNKWRSHLSLRNFNKTSATTSPRTSGSLQACILFFIGALCQQGPHFSTHLLSGRTIVLSTLIFTFIISQFFSGTIVGTIITEKPKTIRTLRDLIDSSLNIAVEDIVYNLDYFRRTTDLDAIELYRTKISQPDGYKVGQRITDDYTATANSINSAEAKNLPQTTHPAAARIRDGKMKKRIEKSWYSPEEGLKLIKAGGYAFHVDVATAYKIIRETFTEQEICELTEIQLFPPQKMVGIVQKSSPLRKMITYGLRRTSETGLMDRQRKVWHSQKPRCVRQIQPNDLRVGMQTFSSALFVLILGLAASVAILAFEVMHDLWHKAAQPANLRILDRSGESDPSTACFEFVN